VEREGGLIFGFKILFMFQVCCKYGRETKAQRERERERERERPGLAFKEKQ
jgi:hypothetical protein